MGALSRAMRHDLPNLLFYRDYRAYQGGHLKLAHYIAHTAASGLFEPRLYLTPDSRPDHPFGAAPLVGQWQPEAADALFLAGLDWEAVPEGIEERVPVINLIQQVRQADPADPRYAFLGRRATRLCVSEAVASALEASGQCNGPIISIPAGIDLGDIPSPHRLHSVLVAGLKQPLIAQIVTAALRALGRQVVCLTEPIPRPQFLAAMARASVVVALPDAREGFYLPAIEAMAAGAAVVCPDALGNRDFCRHGETCLMPPANPAMLVEAALRLLNDSALRRRLVVAGREMAWRHGLKAERRSFHTMLGALSKEVERRRALTPVPAAASDRRR